MNEVIENPFYTCFETLEILVKLKEKNFLLLKDSLKTIAEETEIRKIDKESPEKKENEYLLVPQDVDKIQKNLKLKDNKPFNILLLNSQNFNTDAFINDLGASIVKVQRNKKYRKMEIALFDKLNMFLYTLRIDKEVVNTFKQLPEEIFGQIFVFDLSENLDFEYMNYVIRYIYAFNKAPTILAISNVGTAKNLTKIKPKFNVPEHVKIIQFDNKKFRQSLTKAILTLKPVTAEKNK
jgi:hypothetical protein